MEPSCSSPLHFFKQAHNFPAPHIEETTSSLLSCLLYICQTWVDWFVSAHFWVSIYWCLFWSLCYYGAVSVIKLYNKSWDCIVWDIQLCVCLLKVVYSSPFVFLYKCWNQIAAMYKKMVLGFVVRLYWLFIDQFTKNCHLNNTEVVKAGMWRICLIEAYFILQSL